MWWLVWTRRKMTDKVSVFKQRFYISWFICVLTKTIPIKKKFFIFCHYILILREIWRFKKIFILCRGQMSTRYSRFKITKNGLKYQICTCYSILVVLTYEYQRNMYEYPKKKSYNKLTSISSDLCIWHCLQVLLAAIGNKPNDANESKYVSNVGTLKYDYSVSFFILYL